MFNLIVWSYKTCLGFIYQETWSTPCFESSYYLESLIPLNCISHLNKHVGNVCLFDVYATYISKRACFYPKLLGRLKAGYLRFSLCTVYVTCMLSTQGCWCIVEKLRRIAKFVVRSFDSSLMYFSVCCDPSVCNIKYICREDRACKAKWNQIDSYINIAIVPYVICNSKGNM